MLVKRNSIITLFIFVFFLANAQSPSDYYHKTANYYIQGEKKNAKKTIEEAISKYPNDPKLKQLAAKVNKLPDDKQDKQKNQQQKNQQQKDQQQKDQQKKEQQQKNQQNKDQQQKDQQQKDQQNKNQQQQQQQKPQMSKENAQQILDALMQDEKNTQDKAKKQQVRGTKKADKDW